MKKRKWRLLLLPLFLLAGGGSIYHFFIAEPGKPIFTISRETTYCLGPVDQEGYIDYVEALDALSREGITPENNALAILMQAFGPAPESALLSDDFFQRLGIARPPVEGEYVVTFTSLFKQSLPRLFQRAQHRDLLDQVMTNPWTEQAAPLAAEWIKVNTKPLAWAHQAALRPRYYQPMVKSRGTGTSGMSSCLLPTLQPTREICCLLLARAMQHLGEGRIAEARHDLLAVFRLSRLVTQDPCLISSLMAFNIHSHAVEAATAWLSDPRVTAEEIAHFRDELNPLPPFAKLHEKIDLTERLMMLDNTLITARDGLSQLEFLSRGSVDASQKKRKLYDLYLGGLKWDPALKDINQWFDRIVEAMREEKREDRKKKLAQLDVEIKQLRVSLGQDGASAFFYNVMSGENRVRTMGNLIRCQLNPNFILLQAAEDRNVQLESLLHVAVALALFQRETGRYPKELEELAPKYLTTSPNDHFSGKSLIYHHVEEGCFVYSIGPNVVADDGITKQEDFKADDLSIRLPRPIKKSKLDPNLLLPRQPDNPVSP